MKILITGHKGMIGSALKTILLDHILVTFNRSELNIGNTYQVMKMPKVDFIVHLAAETDHEYCDLNPSHCYYVNTIGTANMMRLAKEQDIPILYLSAGSVFDGEKGSPYMPFDKPNPINHYNSSKWYGEEIIQSYRKHFILRAGWMFGGGPGIDKKFVYKIYKKIRNGQEEIMVCNDCIGSPTYTIDLSKCIENIIKFKDSYNYGTYHFVNEGVGVSRYDFAREIVEIIGTTTRLKACFIDDLKEEFPCKRTNYDVLQSSFKSRHWSQALKEYLENNFPATI